MNGWMVAWLIFDYLVGCALIILLPAATLAHVGGWVIGAMMFAAILLLTIPALVAGMLVEAADVN